MSGRRSVSPSALEQGARECAVRVHAVEAVVRCRDRGRQHLAVGALDRGAGEVVDEQFVGEAAQVDAELGRQPEGGEDPRDVGQPADDRSFLGSLESFVVARHLHRLLSFDPREAEVWRKAPGAAALSPSEVTRVALGPRLGR